MDDPADHRRFGLSKSRGKQARAGGTAETLIITMAIVAAPDHCQDIKNIFDLDYLQQVPKRGVIHVGADIGQEVPLYFEYGFRKVMLIEANPEKYDVLRKKFDRHSNVTLFNYAALDKEGVVDFHIHTSRTGSTEPASVLPMKRFKEIVKTLHTARTIKVPAITLDGLFGRHSIAADDYNFINIDIQGAESLALAGATKVIAAMDAIICEVNVVELYENGALEADIIALLSRYGFERRHAVYHTLYDESSTFPAWGECLFVKRRAAVQGAT
jgi:FkbM family methyltransferase